MAHLVKIEQGRSASVQIPESQLSKVVVPCDGKPMGTSESIKQHFDRTGFCRIDGALRWWGSRYLVGRSRAALGRVSFDTRGWGEHCPPARALLPKLRVFTRAFEEALAAVCGKRTSELGNLEYPQYAFARDVRGGPGYDRHIDGAALDREEPAGRYEVLIAILLNTVGDESEGAFVFWPGSHHDVFENLRAREQERLRTAIHDCVPDLIAGGNATLARPPIAFTGRTGDAVICHHLLVHGNAPRRVPGVRQMAFFRPAYVAYEKDALVQDTSFVRL